MQTLPISHIRQQLPQIIHNVSNSLTAEYGVTVGGVLRAKIVNSEYLDSLLETLEILGNKKLMKDLKESHAQALRGDGISLDDYLAKRKIDLT